MSNQYLKIFVLDRHQHWHRDLPLVYDLYFLDHEVKGQGLNYSWQRKIFLVNIINTFWCDFSNGLQSLYCHLIWTAAPNSMKILWKYTETKGVVYKISYAIFSGTCVCTDFFFFWYSIFKGHNFVKNHLTWSRFKLDLYFLVKYLYIQLQLYIYIPLKVECGNWKFLILFSKF